MEALISRGFALPPSRRPLDRLPRTSAAGTLSEPRHGAPGPRFLLLLVLGFATTSPCLFARIAFEHGKYWAAEDEGYVQIAITRGGSTSEPVTVSYATTNGTAKAGADYQSSSGTVDFAAGERVKLLAIPVVNDGERKAARSFTVGLGKPSGETPLGSPRTASVTLVDNDPGIQFVQNRLWVRESDEVVVLTVTRGNDALLDPFDLDYATTNGTAQAGLDYVAVTGTLAFAAGEMTRSFPVPILPRDSPTKDRQFKVILDRLTTGQPMGSANGTVALVTIVDTREMQGHRIDALRVHPDGSVSLGVAGGHTPDLGVINRFRSNFDIVPIEVSTDLTEWTPRTWLVRTNASLDALSWTDTEGSSAGPRFYRTPKATFVAPQRPPSGPYPVGFTDRVIADGTRRNRYRISTNGSFPLTVWYPAKRMPGRWPDEPYHPEGLARDPRPGGWEGAVDRSPHWKRYALSNAPFADGLAGRPVVVWSSGYLYARYDVQEWAEHLASHGYVVVAADHSDSSTVVFPDGRYLYTHYGDTAGREVDLRLLQDRVRDCTLILDELTRWNRDDPLLSGRLNPDHSASMGWSLGGGTAVEFCRLDPRVKAAISLDGAFLNLDVLRSAGVPKPLLAMSQLGRGDSTLFDAVARDAVFFEIRDILHDGFSTYYWDLQPAPADGGREAARTIVDYSLWFVNRYLGGSSDPLPAPVDYGLIANLRRK